MQGQADFKYLDIMPDLFKVDGHEVHALHNINQGGPTCL